MAMQETGRPDETQAHDPVLRAKPEPVLGQELTEAQLEGVAGGTFQPSFVGGVTVAAGDVNSILQVSPRSFVVSR